MSPQIENGYLKIANEIVEALARTHLSGDESKILWVIFRKTYGFNKKTDWISYSQFKEMTGMLNPNTCRTLRRLEERNIVIKTDNKYSFNKDYKLWKSPTKVIKTDNSKKSKIVIKTDNRQLSKLITPVIKTDNSELSKLINTKDNTTKDNIQKTILQKTGTPKQQMMMFLEICKNQNNGFENLLKELEKKGVPRDLGKKELLRFCGYWTELNGSGTKQRWQMEKTFQVERRLGTWFSRIRVSEKKGIRI